MKIDVFSLCPTSACQSGYKAGSLALNGKANNQFVLQARKCSVITINSVLTHYDKLGKGGQI